MFTIDNFISGLQISLPKFQITIDNDILLISMPTFNEPPEEEYELWGQLSISYLQSIIQNIPDETTMNDSIYYSKTGFEVALRSQDRFRSTVVGSSERDLYIVSEHGHSLQISKASPEYLIALMCFFATHQDYKPDFRTGGRHLFLKDELRTVDEIVDYFKFFTAKITTPVEYSISELKRMLNSYLFNISYNKNTVLDIANFSETREPQRRSVRRNGQLFPYRAYNPELVRYYYQGATTDLPFTQYLAFYHVAEYFFQTIAEQDAFQEIESFITRPSFSPYKKEDIRQFYNRVKKRMRDQREDGLWDEKTGLLLCLKKHVPDIDALKNAISSIDSSAIDYYSNCKVSFADDGCTINFNDSLEAIFAGIRNRVYSVRNAIVHSKEGEKLRYEPFKHDKELLKEVPLIRAIAEEIIINSAKPIDFRSSD